MWSTPIVAWYRECGRHRLPWRTTRDPWAILVSEVMLQQTPVARVLPRWQVFLARWPTPQALAAAPLAEVLRSWDGLGYPRRARHLQATATAVAARGWPGDERGLRALPGVGPYTARALLTFAFDLPSAPPRDVNAARVVARAAFGTEPQGRPTRDLDAELVAARPAQLEPRHWAYALFDLGATVCRARRPRCSACPLRRRCAAPHPPPGPAEKRAPYQGSMRQLRGAVLRALLADPATEPAQLRARLAYLEGARRPGAIEEALASLRRDGLLPASRTRG